MEETRQLSGNCQTLSDRDQNMASIDRLSSLPDDVKCHILSFLPTKLSVATSVLEKRWRFVWAHVPCLDFSGGDFRKKGTQTSEDFLLEETWLEETQDSDDLREEEGTQASDIIHSIILGHNTNRMDTLKLCYIKCNEYQLDIWIRTAIERSIRNLYLELDFDTLSLYLFNCKTIVDLTLRISRVSISAVDNVSLPSLKKFYVYNLICENDDVLPRFLSGCPSLEELILKFTFVEDNYVGCIKVSSPTIKMLQLSFNYLSCNLECRTIINAPALRYLEVDGYNLECMTIPITMISLVEANINIENCSFSNLKMNYNSTVVKFLHSLCYVKCLTISCWKFEEFIHRGLACSTVKLDNLTKLQLRLDFKWSFLVKFLEVADNLQILSIYFLEGYLCPEPEQVPKCLLSCLKSIKIEWMWFSEHEFDMVRYL